MLAFPLYTCAGGSLSGDLVTDEELFIRWLEIVAFLPVISFHTPPWVCGEDRVYQHTTTQHTPHYASRVGSAALLTQQPVLSSAGEC